MTTNLSPATIIDLEAEARRQAADLGHEVHAFVWNEARVLGHGECARCGHSVAVEPRTLSDGHTYGVVSVGGTALGYIFGPAIRDTCKFIRLKNMRASATLALARLEGEPDPDSAGAYALAKAAQELASRAKEYAKLYTP